MAMRILDRSKNAGLRCPRGLLHGTSSPIGAEGVVRLGPLFCMLVSK